MKTYWHPYHDILDEYERLPTTAYRAPKRDITAIHRRGNYFYQFQIARATVITTVANNTTTRLLPITRT